MQTNTPSLMDMLYSAPDDMVYLVQQAITLVAAGKWAEAAQKMLHAGDFDDTLWHDLAYMVSNSLREQARKHAA